MLAEKRSPKNPKMEQKSVLNKNGLSSFLPMLILVWHPLYLKSLEIKISLLFIKWLNTLGIGQMPLGQNYANSLVVKQSLTHFALESLTSPTLLV